MAVPVARVHLKVAHAALPALLPTPPKWKMLPPLLPTPCLAAILPKPPATAKPGRADADERWDAHKAKPTSAEPSASSSSGPRSASADSVKNRAGHGSCRKNVTSPPPKPGRADSADAHKKAASPVSSSSSSGTSSPASSSKSTISRATSAERWDVRQKRRPPQADQLQLDDGNSSSSGSNGDIDMEEGEILWEPRAMYAGPGFVAAVPVPSMLPMPTAFLLPVS